MTIRTALVDMLRHHGVLERDANEIVRDIEPELLADAQRATGTDLQLFNEEATEYPEVLITELFKNVKRHAYERLKVSSPQAWYLDALKAP